MVDKHIEGRQNLPDGLHGRRRVLVPAQVHHDPRHVAQERNWDFRVDEAEQGLDDAEPDDVVTEVRTVSNYVAQGPNSLLAYILRRSSLFKQVVWGALSNHVIISLDNIYQYLYFKGCMKSFFPPNLTE